MLSFFLSLDERMGQKYYGGAERQETAEARAERILAEELRRRQWSLGELARRRKGDKEKVKIGRRLRNENDDDAELDCRAAGHGGGWLRGAMPA